MQTKGLSSESEVAQSCLTLCNPTDCSLPGSSVHGIFQAIVLEWIAISFSRGSSQPRDQTQVSRIVDRRFTIQATREVPRVFSKKASILRYSAFFIVQLSHPYMTTGKTIALTRRTFVGKVMSLLFNMACRLVITFLPRSKGFLISWLQSPSAVILEPKLCSLEEFFFLTILEG